VPAHSVSLSIDYGTAPCDDLAGANQSVFIVGGRGRTEDFGTATTDVTPRVGRSTNRDVEAFAQM
jgi:hypothetical protein